MKLLGVLACVGLAAAAVSGWGAEASFDRTVMVSGKAELTVSTGSGTIHLTQGPEGRIHIVGRVRSSWDGSEERVREIAAHPPIEQTGDIVRVGGHQEEMHNISIDYEIEAPAGAILEAASGSGEVTDDGVGMDAKLHTGSGTIHATGLRGSFAVTTGSGSIYAEQSGEGDVKAETGSGSIELRNLHGSLRAQTGSGGIKAQGAPAGPWRLTTGSGGVEIWTGGAGVTLDAQTGSGSIHSDREIATQGTLGKHHVTGRIGGGGAEVRIETGSGSIGIH
jgi:hypothetical protein